MNLPWKLTLSDGTTTITVDYAHAIGGFTAEIARAREPREVWTAAGTRELIAGPGYAARVMTIAATTAATQAAPSIDSLNFANTLTATLYHPSGTTTVLSGKSRGLDAYRSDQIGGTVQWGLTIVGTVTSGLDPQG